MSRVLEDHSRRCLGSHAKLCKLCTPVLWVGKKLKVECPCPQGERFEAYFPRSLSRLASIKLGVITEHGGRDFSRGSTRSQPPGYRAAGVLTGLSSTADDTKSTRHKLAATEHRHTHTHQCITLGTATMW